MIDVGGAKVATYYYADTLFSGRNEYVRTAYVPLPEGLFSETPWAVAGKNQTANSRAAVSVNMNVAQASKDGVTVSVNSGEGVLPENMNVPFTLIVVGW